MKREIIKNNVSKTRKKIEKFEFVIKKDCFK